MHALGRWGTSTSQGRVYHEDRKLRVTESEIRSKRPTIRANSVTSVSIASFRPGKWFPVVVLIVRLFGVAGLSLFAPMVIPAVMVVLLSYLRASCIYLQTSGGPVALAIKAELGNASSTPARYALIRDSIKQAMRAA